MPAYEAQLSDEGDAAERYIGFPPDTSERRRVYEEASASSCLPLKTTTLLVAGTRDIDVPLCPYLPACQGTLITGTKLHYMMLSFYQTYGTEQTSQTP